MEGNDMQERQSTAGIVLKVAKAKTRLSILIIIQAIVQFIAILAMILSVLMDKNPNVLAAIYSIGTSYFSLLILELGRRHSQVDYLRVYMIVSCAAAVMSINCVVLTIVLLQYIQDPSIWETKKFELLTNAGILLGAMVHIFLRFTTNSLIRNMSPPENAIDVLPKLADCHTLLNGNEREKMEGNNMQQRNCTTGSKRPSGADDFDFSYRMVINSRHTEVAKGELRLAILILTQLIIQFVGFLTIFLSLLKERNPNVLAVQSIATGYISLLILELGRSQSRVDYMRFYMFVSSAPILMSMSCVVLTIVSLEGEGTSIWETKKFELLTNAGFLLGALVHIFLMFTTNSLIRSLCPPKGAVDGLP